MVGAFTLSVCIAMAPAVTKGINDISRADKAFAAQNFTLAADLYQQALQRQPNDLQLHYRLGICYLRLQNPEKATHHLEKVHHAKPHYTDVLTRYLAEANHLSYNFEKAREYYQEELRHASRLDTRYQVSLQKRLEECAAGIALAAVPPAAVLTNLGPSINTKYADYLPVLFTADSVMLFTTRKPPARKYQQAVELVKVVVQEQGKWQPAQLYLKQHKPLQHHAVVSAAPDGSELYTYLSGKMGGLFSTKRAAAGWGKPVLLGKPFNKGEEELAVHITDDGRFAVFSSDRAGGYGGLDLYLCQRLPDGNWSEAMNLGPQVNTNYDEDAPFVDTSTNTLYFSSRGHNSIGGYDVFKSVIEQGQWMQVENLGLPVNSPADDIYFIWSKDKSRAYLSSDRAGGAGDSDIYSVIFY